MSEANTGKSQKELDHWAKYAPLPIDIDFDSQFNTNSRNRLPRKIIGGTEVHRLYLVSKTKKGIPETNLKLGSTR